MTKGVLISVIVPVYNMETLLPICIESIINQTYKNLEIILIDDGSTDRSLEICKKYSAQDSRIKVLHKDNGGQASARNLGIDVSSGEYIGFVDSDDWIMPQMYEVLLKNIQIYQADISCCETVYIKNGVTINNCIDRDSNIQVFNNYEAMKEHLNLKSGLGQSPVDKIYKKQLFNTVRFLNQRGYEDTGTIFKLFIEANKVVYVEKYLYNYVFREDSTMNKKFSELDFNRIKAYKEIEKVLSKEDKYIELVPIATRYKVGAILYVLGELLVNNSNSFKSLRNKVIEEVKITLNSNIILQPKQRYLLKLIVINDTLYGLLYKLLKKK